MQNTCKKHVFPCLFQGGRYVWLAIRQDHLTATRPPAFIDSTLTCLRRHKGSGDPEMPCGNHENDVKCM